MERTAIIAFGANLGEPSATLARAWRLLEERFSAKLRVSSLYVTAPLVPPGQSSDGTPDFVNAALSFDTAAPPEDILAVLLSVEAEFGRTRGINSARWAPRLIDLDLIALGDVVVSSTTLTLPHPRMEARDFVLVPLAELAPEWRHPVTQKTAWEMLERLKAEGAPRFIKAVHPFESER